MNFKENTLKEGPHEAGVIKWELESAYFWTGKWDLSYLGLGTDRHKNGNIKHHYDVRVNNFKRK
jgi:hypothetical protein